MMNVIRCSKRALFALLTVALPPAILAQEDEEIYELSPFNISEDENVGYLATSTLAGTRLETPLRDIGAAVSVLTPELFEDTGAVNAATILPYATSSEVGGVQGNFAGSGISSGRADSTNQRINPQGNNRIRGLVSASLTRNFFLTDIPFDTYNSSRITMNRGG